MPQEVTHVALPKLYGQPAYARPPRGIEDQPRPFDPDELPLEVEMSDEERMVAENLNGQPYTNGGVPVGGHRALLTAPPLRRRLHRVATTAI